MKGFTQRLSTLLAALLLACLILPVRAYAATVSVSGPSTVRAGETVTVTLSISGDSFYSVEAKLTYDSTVLTLSDCKWDSSLSAYKKSNNGTKYVVYDDSLEKPMSSGNILQAVFTVNSNVAAGTTLTAGFTDVSVTTKDSSGHFVDSEAVSKSWSGKVDAPLSTNCDLTSITVANATLSPAFNKNTTYYTVKVPYSIQKLNLDYNRAETTQTVSISGNGNFVVGENTVTLTVKSAAGTTKKYTIVATREQDPNYKPSDDATLSALTMEGGVLSPKFDPTVLEYIAFVPHETEEITLIGTPSSKKALGVTDAKQTLTRDGETTCTVVCTAEDGTSKKTYTVHVYRLPAYTGGIPLIEFTNEEDIEPEVPEVVEEVVPTTYEIPMRVTLPVIGETSVLVAGGVAAGLLVIILFLLGLVVGRVTAPYEEDEDRPVEPKHRPQSRPNQEERVRHEPCRELYFEPVEEYIPKEKQAIVQPEQPRKAEPPIPETAEEPLDEDEREAADRVKGMSLDDLLDDIHNM